MWAYREVGGVMAFTGDDSWYDHLDEVFGPESGIVTVPQGAVFENPEARVGVIMFGELRDADRSGRGCAMPGGPSRCRVYRAQACTGGGQSCSIQELMDRLDH